MKIVYLFTLLVLFLSGCGDYPGHLPNDPVKLSSLPTWVESVRREIPDGGDCHIDSVNDKSGEGPQSHTVSRSGTPLKVTGWGAISVKNGVAATDIAISLKPEFADGLRFFAATAKLNRPDVAAYFKNPASVDTGFSAVIDLSDAQLGNYVLEVIQHKDGKNFKCQLSANIIVVK